MHRERSSWILLLRRAITLDEISTPNLASISQLGQKSNKLLFDD